MRLRTLLALLQGWYPPERAEEWDAVGLVCGDPEAEVRQILLAVDPVQAVVDEAVSLDVDLVIVHHPLYLRGTTSVAASTAKGKVVHDLISAGSALFTAHTNADSPAGGVSDSIARALGLLEIRPLVPEPLESRDKIITFVPVDDAEKVRTAMTDAGAGRIGDYEAASFSTRGEGRFRPVPGANPTVGSVGESSIVDEVRIEVIADRVSRSEVVAAMLAAHPYEEPAYDVVELADLPDEDCGSGRVGVLPEPLSLRAFAELVERVLPKTAHGVRVAGDPEQRISTVALCGGAGDSFLGAARRAWADVYLTSDLRHHPASEYREDGGPALVDVAHWAAESMWLPVLRQRLVGALGDTVTVHISTITTDPWTFRV